MSNELVPVNRKIVHIPVVGMGATESIGSDRYPYTIISVINSRRIVVQADTYQRIDKNGLSESQEYLYQSNPEGSTKILTLRKNGRWCEQKVPMRYSCWGIGNRNAHQDPHF